MEGVSELAGAGLTGAVEAVGASGAELVAGGGALPFEEVSGSLVSKDPTAGGDGLWVAVLAGGVVGDMGATELVGDTMTVSPESSGMVKRPSSASDTVAGKVGTVYCARLLSCWPTS